MRRTLLLIGMIFAGLAAAAPRADAALSPVCTQLLRLDLPPESRPPPPAFSTHYILRTIARANRGIIYSRTEPSVPDMTPLLPSWIPYLGSAMASLVDVQLRLIDQSRDLKENTACLHYDFVLLECQIDDVRNELRMALQQGRTIAILRLTDLLQFLGDRQRHLLLGARNPDYTDPTWGQRRSFDPPEQVWCCPASTPGNACVRTAQPLCLTGGGTSFETLDQCLGFGCREPVIPAPEETTLCPFHSDYEPPMLESGLGCDERAMTGSRLAFIPMQDERTALVSVMTQVELYRQQARELMEMQSDLGFARDPLPPPLAPRPDHQTIMGCIRQRGACSMNAAVECGNDGDCAAQSLGTCVLPSDVVLMKRTLRSSFSAARDHLGILEDFLRKRRQEGLSREFVDDLKTAPEFPPTKAAERARREREDFFQLGIRTGFREVFRQMSKLQGEQEAATYPLAGDSQLTIAGSLSYLRGSVAALSVQAGSRDGVRRFVVGLAYYARRTCIYRPCSMRLDQILKLALTDECFPYTNGAYLSDTPQNPRWKRCAAAACIAVPGGDPLPASCANIP